MKDANALAKENASLRAVIKDIEDYGTEEINAAYELRQQLVASLMREAALDELRRWSSNHPDANVSLVAARGQSHLLIEIFRSRKSTLTVLVYDRPNYFGEMDDQFKLVLIIGSKEKPASFSELVKAGLGGMETVLSRNQ